MKRKKQVSYLSSVLSISMFLLMLGLFGILYIQSSKLATYVRENMIVQVFVDESLSQEDINRIKSQMEEKGFAREIRYVTSEQAAAEFSQEIGQDFTSFLGFNPLKPSFQIRLKENFTAPLELQKMEGVLRQMQGINEINYERDLFQRVNNNMRSVGMILLGISLLFLIISAILINNTVKLNLYARRFAIKTMQLVGATNWFIVKPFVWQSIRNGFFGWFICMVIIMSLLNSLPAWLPDAALLNDPFAYLELFILLLAIGLIMSALSTITSTQRYLNSKIEDLY